MTREEATEAITLLAKEFRIQRPRLFWTRKASRGRARYRKYVITSGPNCWRGTEQSLIHEFAHMLTYKRYGAHVAQHGEEFRYCLWHVVIAWFGNPSRYAWDNEYKRVGQFGKQRLQPEVESLSKSTAQEE